MKHITSMILTLAMLASLAMVSCEKDTQDPANTAGTTTPAVTTEAASTTAETDAETTVEETTEPTPELPEFDINSDECLLYRLMGMTFGKIKAEFGEENVVSGNISENGDSFYTLYLNNGISLNITYYKSDDCYVGDGSWHISEGALPGSITAQNADVSVYPGINTSMSASDVSKIISDWDSSNIYGLGHISTVVYIEGYSLEVSWVMESDLCAKINAELEGKSDDEVKTIKQKYADEFMKNMDTDSSKIRGITISHNKY